MEDHKTIQQPIYPLGIDIGSTTVKVAVLNEKHELLFSDYEDVYKRQGDMLLLIPEFPLSILYVLPSLPMHSI